LDRKKELIMQHIQYPKPILEPVADFQKAIANKLRYEIK